MFIWFVSDLQTLGLHVSVKNLLIFLFSPLSQKKSVKVEKGQEGVKLSSIPKTAKGSYLAMDKDKEVIGYVVPVFRAK